MKRRTALLFSLAWALTSAVSAMDFEGVPECITALVRPSFVSILNQLPPLPENPEERAALYRTKNGIEKIPVTWKRLYDLEHFRNEGDETDTWRASLSEVVADLASEMETEADRPEVVVAESRLLQGYHAALERSMEMMGLSDNGSPQISRALEGVVISKIRGPGRPKLQKKVHQQTDPRYQRWKAGAAIDFAPVDPPENWWLKLKPNIKPLATGGLYIRGKAEGINNSGDVIETTNSDSFHVRFSSTNEGRLIIGFHGTVATLVENDGTFFFGGPVPIQAWGRCETDGSITFHAFFYVNTEFLSRCRVGGLRFQSEKGATASFPNTYYRMAEAQEETKEGEPWILP